MTDTGLKGECCLNESRYFHIAGNKIFDIMHDLLCGICPMVVKLILRHYVTQLYGRIEEIIVLENKKCYFMISRCETKYFDVTLNAYRIQPGSNNDILQFFDIYDLAFYKPFSHWTKSLSGSMYISHRHIII